jgi:outer membrane lipoprotein SlyB
MRLGSQNYSRERAHTVQDVLMMGIVNNEGTKTPIGAALGGLGGKAATRQAGVEIAVRLDPGKLIANNQATDEKFRLGDRVSVPVLSGGGTTRVTH